MLPHCSILHFLSQQTCVQFFSDENSLSHNDGKRRTFVEQADFGFSQLKRRSQDPLGLTKITPKRNCFFTFEGPNFSRQATWEKSCELAQEKPPLFLQNTPPAWSEKKSVDKKGNFKLSVRFNTGKIGTHAPCDDIYGMPTRIRKKELIRVSDSSKSRHTNAWMMPTRDAKTLSEITKGQDHYVSKSKCLLCSGTETVLMCQGFFLLLLEDLIQKRLSSSSGNISISGITTSSHCHQTCSQAAKFSSLFVHYHCEISLYVFVSYSVIKSS